ncbi:sugar transferase [Ensifer sp. ENS11]|uniref:sugar transferase n=1 Tax=Ensifer sp. ENS11 TaxID=2769291 RepID=UPI001FEDBB77|nr:sugar transferase [Ensifer sp. ENS11]
MRRNGRHALDMGPIAVPAENGRIDSVLIAGVLLVLCLPLMLLAAAIVFATLGWPLIFRQLRAGLGAKPFSIVKFRTMREGRDANGHLLPDHLRATRLTWFLRRTRLDELPQFLSVARGEMAFVGPRPLGPTTIAEFGELGRVRCRVLPGITGWAQVNGNTLLSNEEKLALDIWYVDHADRWLDTRILVMTVLTLLAGEKRNDRHLAEARRHIAERYGAAAPFAPLGESHR